MSKRDLPADTLYTVLEEYRVFSIRLVRPSIPSAQTVVLSRVSSQVQMGKMAQRTPMMTSARASAFWPMRASPAATKKTIGTAIKARFSRLHTSADSDEVIGTRLMVRDP